MANIKSAIKRVKTAEKRRVANVQRKSAMRSAIKAVETFAAEGNKDQAVLAFATASKKSTKLLLKVSSTATKLVVTNHVSLNS